MIGLVDRLSELDASLEARGIARLSLAPGRERATSFARLGAAVSKNAPALSGDACRAFAEGLSDVAGAIADHFPDNLFCDLDYLVAALTRDAAAATQPAEYLRTQLALAAELHAMFGKHSTIRFRYIHDFVYGYDWAKWVRRDPGPRHRHGPFSPAFLAYTKQRGEELVALIAEDDAKYRKLCDDEVARNPFGFSREPDAEMAIHRDLARSATIPVEAWRWDATPRWRANFAELRRARAVALGYGR